MRRQMTPIRASRTRRARHLRHRRRRLANVQYQHCRRDRHGRGRRAGGQTRQRRASPAAAGRPTCWPRWGCGSMPTPPGWKPAWRSWGSAFAMPRCCTGDAARGGGAQAAGRAHDFQYPWPVGQSGRRPVPVAGRRPQPVPAVDGRGPGLAGHAAGAGGSRRRRLGRSDPGRRHPRGGSLAGWHWRLASETQVYDWEPADFGLPRARLASFASTAPNRARR